MTPWRSASFCDCLFAVSSSERPVKEAKGRVARTLAIFIKRAGRSSKLSRLASALRNRCRREATRSLPQHVHVQAQKRRWKDAIQAHLRNPAIGILLRVHPRIALAGRPVMGSLNTMQSCT
jgi:hypothetical protein